MTGHVLLVVGVVLAYLSVATDVGRGCPPDGGVRRVGRVALSVLGVVTRPLRPRTRAERRARCARYGHLDGFDGRVVVCRRCDAVRRTTTRVDGWPSYVWYDRDTSRASTND